jgi:hypothetical protein
MFQSESDFLQLNQYFLMFLHENRGSISKRYVKEFNFCNLNPLLTLVKAHKPVQCLMFLFSSDHNSVLNISLYPGDLYSFTRRPCFLIVDSDNSSAFASVPHHFDQPLVVLMSPQDVPSTFRG